MRSRQLQEDAARQRLAAAQRDAERAATRVRYDRDRLDALIAAGATDSAPAFVAAAVALQAAAATHAAAVDASRAAHAGVDARRSTVRDTARDRRSAELMQERHAAELRAAEEAAATREMDEIAARVHRDGLPREGAE